MYRLLLIAFFPVLLSAQGIQFEHDSWSATLAKAKLERKVVFVDAYTVWCGPCKAMARDVFTDAQAGAFYNANFLNVKMDMERGDGIEVSNKYKIWAYPSLLFLNGDGEILHRVTGYHAVDEFINLGKTALDSTRNLAALEKKYAAGARSSAFMLAYLEAKSRAYDPETGKRATQYLQSQTDLGTPENKEVMMRYVDDPTGPAFAFLIKNRPVFEQQYGSPEVKSKIESVFYAYFEANPAFQLVDIQDAYKKYYPEEADRLGSAYSLYWYSQREDAEHYMEAALAHFARFTSDNSEELHEAAWFFCENATSPESLKAALGWILRSVELVETPYNQFTLARLYAKTAAPDAARKAAQRSIELAKAMGEDTEMVEEFLESLK